MAATVVRTASAFCPLSDRQLPGPEGQQHRSWCLVGSPDEVVRFDVELGPGVPGPRKTKVRIEHLQVVETGLEREELLTPRNPKRRAVEENVRTGESQGPVQTEILRAQKQSLTGLGRGDHQAENLPSRPLAPPGPRDSDPRRSAGRGCRHSAAEEGGQRSGARRARTRSVTRTASGWTPPLRVGCGLPAWRPPFKTVGVVELHAVEPRS